MCKPASMVVVKTGPVWSKYSDCHEDIIDEHKIHMDGVRGPNAVRVEICPANGDLSSAISKWKFSVDQDVLPLWWDASKYEKLCRAELKKWKQAKIITKDTAVLKDGEFYVYGGTIQYVYGGTIQYVRGGTIQSVYGGTIQSVEGGTIQSVYGGTIQYVRGGTIQYVRGGTIQSVEGGTIIVYTTIDPKILTTTKAIMIDRKGSTVKVWVGGKKPKELS